MTRNERANSGSKLGAMLASADSVVGLGNIWRSPFEAGNHGGAAFILIYLVYVLILDISIIIAESLIGRHSRTNTAGAYHKLAPDTQRHWVGRTGVLTGLPILGYCSVAAGWTLEFIGKAAASSFTGRSVAEFISSFNRFISSLWCSVVWLVVFLLATHFTIVKGVEKGTEKSTKIVIPMPFILLIVLVICSIPLPGAEAGTEFLLKSDFSKVDGNVFLKAMGQAFFSFNLGMGCPCTYASYLRDDTNLLKMASNMAGIDMLVAILVGFIVSPAAFPVGTRPGTGPSLLFITLPSVFQQVFGDTPWLAIALSLMFYTLLALVALTSTASPHKVVAVYLYEGFKFIRKKTARLATAGCIILEVLCSLSLGVGKNYTIFGLNLLDLFNFLTAKIMLLLGGLFISTFIDQYLDKKIVREEVSNNGTLNTHIYKLLISILKSTAPIGIILIFINELSFLKQTGMRSPLKDFLCFPRGERRGILVLIIGIIVILLLGYIYSFQQNNRIPSDKEIQSQVTALREYDHFINSMCEQDKNVYSHFDKFPKHKEKAIILTPLDPNHADFTIFCQLGLPSWMAEDILLYRNKGGELRKTEDFKRVYGLTKEQYRALAPYIHFTAEGTIREIASLCHPAPPQKDSIYKYLVGTVLDLNNTDTAEPKKIPGIGGSIARLIVGHQRRLGGFHKIEQLEETHLDYHQLQTWFIVAPSEIRRVNLNHAGIERPCYHPYINFYQTEAFVECRRRRDELHNLKPFALYEEFTKSDLKWLSHYVCFE